MAPWEGHPPKGITSLALCCGFVARCCTYHILEHCSATRLVQKRFKCQIHFNCICCTIMESWYVLFIVAVEKTWFLDKGPFHPQTCRSTFLGLETSIFSYVCNCLYYTWLSQFNSQVLQKNLPLSDCRWK